MDEHSRPLGDGPASSAALARALGVTRVARLTGLDRTGVEVASAVRPGAHVLQVTNGKGARFADAARGALFEAAELWGAEHPDPAAEVGPCSAAELQARVGPGETVIAPAWLGPLAAGEQDTPAPEEADLRRAWCLARGLSGARAAWVPFDAVHCPPPGGPARLATLRWTSNGMGAHPRRAAALLHALLEAVERDQLARALPDGFTAEEVSGRALDPRSLAAAAPATAALATRLCQRGFRVHLLDLSPRLSRRVRSRGPEGPGPLDLGLPTAAALLVDEDGGPVPVAAGYACRLSRDAALGAALLEAAQSRATEIHGAREDVAVGDRRAAAPLAALLAAARPRREAGSLPEARAPSPAAGVRRVLERLAGAGLGLAAAVDLPAPDGVRVVKVIVPGLLLSHLL